jgi:hypothetical protein
VRRREEKRGLGTVSSSYYATTSLELTRAYPPVQSQVDAGSLLPFQVVTSNGPPALKSSCRGLELEGEGFKWTWLGRN